MARGIRLEAAWRAALLLAVAFVWSAPADAKPANGNSAATVTGAFEGCGEFMAHSSKDIGHVEIHYADGRVVKDDPVDDPDYAIATDEMDAVMVKSGTTREWFECEGSPDPPTALLERRAGASDPYTPRGDWTSRDCGFDGTTFCSYGAGVGQRSVTFRGINSSDPDGDLTTWSIDFADGTAAGGSWETSPPAEVSHDYGTHGCVCTVVLTVTDSVGNTSSDEMVLTLDNDGLD